MNVCDAFLYAFLTRKIQNQFIIESMFSSENNFGASISKLQMIESKSLRSFSRAELLGENESSFTNVTSS